MSIHKAALITGQEHNRMRLLNRLTEPTRGEVDLPPVTLGLIITQPILQERRVQRRRAQAVEAEVLAGVDHGQLPRQGQDGTLGGGVGELRSGASHNGHHGRGVDDGRLGLLVAAEGQHGVFAAEPNTLDVDVHGEIPDLLGGADGVVVLGVHDARVVEDDVQTTGLIEGLDHGLDLGLLGDIAEGGGDLGAGHELEELGFGFFQGGLGNVGH